MHFFICLLCFLTSPSASKVTHDVDSHIQFPEKLKFDEHLPEAIGYLGHKRKLGMQRRPAGTVPLLAEGYQHRTVWKQHIEGYWPALLRNGLNNSLATLAWNDQYLTEKFGTEQVLVEQRIENRKIPPRRMTLANFLKGYKENNWYVVTMLPNTMRKDILIPNLISCSTFRSNLQEFNLWIGSNGTRSLLHFDADHIVHCLVSGRKDWILIDRKYKDRLDLALESRTFQASGHSHVDVDAVDITQHADLYDIPWNYVTLRPGDCLLLPSKFIHQVRSYSRSISVSFLVSPSKKFDDSDCNQSPEDRSTMTADDVDVFWDRDSDHRFIDMGYVNMQVFRQVVIGLMDFISIRCYKKTELWYLLAFALEMEEQETEEFFGDLDANEDGCVDVVEAVESDRESWKKLARAIDRPHGPTSLSEESKLESLNEKKEDGYEYAEDSKDDDIHVEYIQHFLQTLLQHTDEDGDVSYNKFLELTNGTDHVAFFALIDVNMDGVVNQAELENTSSYTLRVLTRLGIRFKDAPEELTHIGVDMNDFKHCYRVIVKKCYKVLVREGRDYLSFGRFSKIASHVIHRPRLSIDFKFMFRIINPREKVMWISKEDLTSLLTDEQLNDTLLVMDDIGTRNEMFSNLFANIIFLSHLQAYSFIQ